MSSTDTTPPRRSRKALSIIEAAADEFLESGFLGTSMDQIAARAGVSKQTVYKNFTDKDQLFTEIVLHTIGDLAETYPSGTAELEDRSGLELLLKQRADALLATAMEPRLLALRRLMIAESARFPELGRLVFEGGFGRWVELLGNDLETLTAGGYLRCPDPAIAAGHFIWLTLGALMHEAMLLGKVGPRSKNELNRVAAAAVSAFVSGYEARESGRRKGTRAR